MPQPSETLKTLAVVLHITEKCNLGCRYCYAKRSKSDMPLVLAYRAIDFVAQLGKDCDTVTIVFSGGEPLLVFENIKKIINYSEKNNINNFIIVTNGLALDEEKISFFASNNASISISVDGIPFAHNLNRPFLDGKGSWKEVDRVLDLLENYLEAFEKCKADSLRLKLTFTPETVKFLEESVHYLADKPIAKSAIITLMPAMLPTGRWKNFLKNRSKKSLLRKELQKIAKLYVKRLTNNNPFNLAINECLSLETRDYLKRKNNTFFCGAGVKKLAISLDGKIYPCYLAAANPKKNNLFCMGDVNKGITHPEVVSKFCGQKQNKAFSCLYWNRVVTGNPDIPASIYSLLCQNWREAVLCHIR